MAWNDNNILVGTGSLGGVYVDFQKSGVLPTDAATPISTFSNFSDLGVIGPDGVNLGREVNATKNFAWDGKNHRTTKNEEAHSITFTVWEDNANVAKLIYGAANVVVDGDLAATIKANTNWGGIYPFVWELVDVERDRGTRWVASQGEVSEVGELALVSGEIRSAEITVDFYPDANGNFWNRYQEDLSS